MLEQGVITQRSFPTNKGQENKKGNRPVRAPERPLFASARSRPQRLKLLLWGDAGAGKTTLSLQFPGVAMIDTEGGSEQYSDQFEFSVLPARDPDEIMGAVTDLQDFKQSAKTAKKK